MLLGAAYKPKRAFSIRPFFLNTDNPCEKRGAGCRITLVNFGKRCAQLSNGVL